jgi:phage tail-like protein
MTAAFRTSAARFRNRPPGPPNDPTWMVIDGRAGWPIAPSSANVAVSGLDCALVLRSLPGGAASLAEPGGTFGGLVPPPHVALAADGTVFLLDRATGRLLRFDDCACAFVPVPCTAGIGDGARQLAAPRALACRGRDMLLLDAGTRHAPGRVLVFAGHGFALRAIWRPPAAQQAHSWRPSAFAVTPDQRTLVADAANGVVHVFDRAGQWRAAWPGWPAVTALAADRFGRIYVLQESAAAISILSSDGKRLLQATDTEAVRDCFAPLDDFASAEGGQINLAGRCAGAGWFGPGGQAVAAPPAAPPGFVTGGTWISTALDSGIGRCQWHRIVLQADLAKLSGITLATCGAEVAQPDALIAAQPDSAWTALGPVGPTAPEALILSPPGRYLWLRVRLSGDGSTTPRLHEMRIEYPRISLRRYLPRAFGMDAVSADFTDRLLAVFDQGFRSIETTIDRQSDLFDARSAPATTPVPGRPDMLSWIAGWIGVSFDRSWPVERRRHYLMQAAKLYACRGTLPGLRRVLLLFLGLDSLIVPRAAATCGPACAPPAPDWTPPSLILEHWKIRRWLFLGAGRLGDAAVLWGETIMGRSQLGTTARAGVSRLDNSRPPEADPFNDFAYGFTVFVPIGLARSVQQQQAVQRLLAQQKPAFTQATLRVVRPRMRIGIQASIGLDSVIGCWPQGVPLESARLGQASVLSAAKNIDPGPRIGASRLGAGVRA